MPMAAPAMPLSKSARRTRGACRIWPAARRCSGTRRRSSPRPRRRSPRCRRAPASRPWPNAGPGSSSSGSRPRRFRYRSWSDPQLLALAAQVFGHVFVHVLEHVGGTGAVVAAQDAVALGFLERLGDFLVERGAGGLVLRLAPQSALDQMAFESLDRIAQREVLRIVGGPVLGGVVRGGMRPGAVADPLDQVGPRSRRARSAAQRDTAYTARKSLPSTRSEGMP